MSLSITASGNAQNGQKVTLDDDDFLIYTLYIASGSKLDPRPLKVMLVVLDIDESTAILPNNSPVQFFAVAYPPPTTYVKSDEDWDLILTVMSENLHSLNALPMTASGESPSLVFNISGPVVHLLHDGEDCVLIDVCAEDYWLVGYVGISNQTQRVDLLFSYTRAPMSHRHSSFKAGLLVGQHTSATATFATRSRTSDKSKSLLMLDLSMAQIFDPATSIVQTFMFYANPPDDHPLLRRLVKQAHSRYALAMAQAEVIPSSVPSLASSSPAATPPTTPSPPLHPRLSSEQPEPVLRTSPRLRELEGRASGGTRTPRSPGVVAALLSARLSTEPGASSKDSFSAPSSKSKKRRSTTEAQSPASGSKTGKSRSKVSEKAKATVIKAAPKVPLLRSAPQRGKLRSGLLNL